MRLNTQEEFSQHKNNREEGNTPKQLKIIFSHLTWTHLYTTNQSHLFIREGQRKPHSQSYLPIFCYQICENQTQVKHFGQRLHNFTLGFLWSDDISFQAFFSSQVPISFTRQSENKNFFTTCLIKMETTNMSSFLSFLYLIKWFQLGLFAHLFVKCVPSQSLQSRVIPFNKHEPDTESVPS